MLLKSKLKKFSISWKGSVSDGKSIMHSVVFDLPQAIISVCEETFSMTFHFQKLLLQCIFVEFKKTAGERLHLHF